MSAIKRLLEELDGVIVAGEVAPCGEPLVLHEGEWWECQACAKELGLGD